MEIDYDAEQGMPQPRHINMGRRFAPHNVAPVVRAPFVSTALLLTPTPRAHAFATEASHHQVADSVCALSDSMVCFVGGSSRGRLSLCVLQCDANRAVALAPLPGRATSIHCCSSRYGTLIAVGGNGYDDGMTVFCVGRKEGKVALLASAKTDGDELGHTNYVRFHISGDGTVLVNQAVNAQRGVLQWAVKLAETAEDGSLEMKLELANELTQRDYPNCMTAREVENEETGETVCVGTCVNDGMLGSVFTIDRSTGIIDASSQRPLDAWFAPQDANINRQSRSSNQPHYCAISNRGLFAVAFEQKEKAVLLFPSVLKLTSLTTLPISLNFPEVMVNIAFSADGNMLAACSRKSVFVFATTPAALEDHYVLHKPLPVQRLDRNFVHVTGLAFSEHKLFVSDNTGVFEFSVLGVASLKDLCVRTVVELLKKDPLFVNVADLPWDVANAIQPSADSGVVFEGEELTSSTDASMRAAMPPLEAQGGFAALLDRLMGRGDDDNEDEFVGLNVEDDIRAILERGADIDDDNDDDDHDWRGD